MKKSDLLRILVPSVLSIIGTILFVWNSMTVRLAKLEISVDANSSRFGGMASREVVELQLQKLGLEVRLVEQKIDGYIASHRKE